MNKLDVKGRYIVQHFGKDGILKGEYDFPNAIVTEGMNHILDTQFDGGTPVTTWYMGLIDNSGFTALSNADTAAEITTDASGANAWGELTEYTEGARPEWTAGAASARSITNAVTVDFSINATKSIEGIFIAEASAWLAITGVLWSTAEFTSTVSAESGDVLKVTYTVSG